VTTTSPTWTPHLYTNLACYCGTQTRVIEGRGHVLRKQYSDGTSAYSFGGPVKQEKSWRHCMGFPVA
jgi:hypothetical protein